MQDENMPHDTAIRTVMIQDHVFTSGNWRGTVQVDNGGGFCVMYGMVIDQYIDVHPK